MAARKKRRRKGYVRKIIISFLTISIAGICFISYRFYLYVYQPNVVTGNRETAYFYIHTGFDGHNVVNSLYQHNFIRNRNSFEWMMRRKNYFNHVHPGRYLLKAGMNNNELINLLRSGKQQPLRIVLRNLLYKEELAGKISRLLEADSTELINLLNDKDYVAKYGFNTENIMTMFIPDSYEFMWNTSSTEFFRRILKEYKRFWNKKRKQKAIRLNYSQQEISILAGIVQKETNVDEEMPVVAGVYLNRLRKGMLLQADPTVVFAVGDFNIRRVLNFHKEIDSPYNTYKYKGLPPGPICMASKKAIDAVLNPQEHQYLYFCAKEDFSGHHNFAKTYAQHLINAHKYQAALNRKRIFK